jgi:hypothetical protein
VYAVDGDLYIADAAGDNATAIVSGPAKDSQPSYKPCGLRRIRA